MNQSSKHSNVTLTMFRTAIKPKLNQLTETEIKCMAIKLDIDKNIDIKDGILNQMFTHLKQGKIDDIQKNLPRNQEPLPWDQLVQFAISKLKSADLQKLRDSRNAQNKKSTPVQSAHAFQRNPLMKNINNQSAKVKLKPNRNSSGFASQSQDNYERFKLKNFQLCLCPYQSSIQKKLIKCRNCQKDYHWECMQWPRDEELSFECPHCIILRHDPLHSVQAVLYDPAIMVSRNNYTFFLDKSQKEQIDSTQQVVTGTGDKYGVEIRALKLDGEHYYEQSWPDRCTISFNGQQLKQFEPLELNSALKKRRDEKLMIKNSKLLVGGNQISFDFENKQDDKNTKKNKNPDYVFMVGFVMRMQVPDLQNHIVKNCNYDEANSKKFISERFEGQRDLQIAEDKVNLECTIMTGTLVDIPVRGRYCKHISCFSLQLYLKSMERNYVRNWQCPLCKKYCYKLIHDQYMDRIIKEAKSKNPQPKNVYFLKNGDYQFESLDSGMDGQQIEDLEDDQADNPKNRSQSQSNLKRLVQNSLRETSVNNDRDSQGSSIRNQIQSQNHMERNDPNSRIQLSQQQSQYQNYKNQPSDHADLQNQWEKTSERSNSLQGGGQHQHRKYPIQHQGYPQQHQSVDQQSRIQQSVQQMQFAQKYAQQKLQQIKQAQYPGQPAALNQQNQQNQQNLSKLMMSQQGYSQATLNQNHGINQRFQGQYKVPQQRFANIPGHPYQNVQPQNNTNQNAAFNAQHQQIHETNQLINQLQHQQQQQKLSQINAPLQNQRHLQTQKPQTDPSQLSHSQSINRGHPPLPNSRRSQNQQPHQFQQGYELPTNEQHALNQKEGQGEYEEDDCEIMSISSDNSLPKGQKRKGQGNKNSFQQNQAQGYNQSPAPSNLKNKYANVPLNQFINNQGQQSHLQGPASSYGSQQQARPPQNFQTIQELQIKFPTGPYTTQEIKNQGSQQLWQQYQAHQQKLRQGNESQLSGDHELNHQSISQQKQGHPQFKAYSGSNNDQSVSNHELFKVPIRPGPFQKRNLGSQQPSNNISKIASPNIHLQNFLKLQMQKDSDCGLSSQNEDAQNKNQFFSLDKNKQGELFSKFLEIYSSFTNNSSEENQEQGLKNQQNQQESIQKELENKVNTMLDYEIKMSDKEKENERESRFVEDLNQNTQLSNSQKDILKIQYQMSKLQTKLIAQNEDLLGNASEISTQDSGSQSFVDKQFSQLEQNEDSIGNILFMLENYIRSNIDLQKLNSMQKQDNHENEKKKKGILSQDSLEDEDQKSQDDGIDQLTLSDEFTAKDNLFQRYLKMLKETEKLDYMNISKPRGGLEDDNLDLLLKKRGFSAAALVEGPDEVAQTKSKNVLEDSPESFGDIWENVQVGNQEEEDGLCQGEVYLKAKIGQEDDKLEQKQEKVLSLLNQINYEYNLDAAFYTEEQLKQMRQQEEMLSNFSHSPPH